MILFEGPESIKGILEKYYVELELKFKEEAKLLKNKEDVLETSFGHFLTTIVQDELEMFPVLSLFVDSEGRGFFAISSTSPYETTSSIYRVEESKVSEPLIELYRNLFPESTELKIVRTILQAPLRLYFISYLGNERLLKREILKDSISGKGYLRLAKEIDDELYDIYVKTFRRWIQFKWGDSFIFPYQDRVKIIFGIPRLRKEIDISTIIELSRFVRTKLIEKYDTLKPSSITPDMKLAKPAATVFEIPLIASTYWLKNLEHFYHYYFKAIQTMIDSLENFVANNDL